MVLMDKGSFVRASSPLRWRNSTLKKFTRCRARTYYIMFPFTMIMSSSLKLVAARLTLVVKKNDEKERKGNNEVNRKRIGDMMILIPQILT